MRTRLIILAGVLVLGSTASMTPPAAAQTACELPACTPQQPFASVDPKFQLLRSQIEGLGVAAPVFGPVPVSSVPSSIGATLRFEGVLGEREIRSIENAGIEFLRNQSGGISRVGAIYRVRVPLERIDRLQWIPGLVRAEVAWNPIELSPLETTSTLIGAKAAVSRPGSLAVDGTGTLIADVDSGIDVLHPHFFRADAGYYGWLDTNENGRFDAGEDAVDLDGDGAADLNETLRVLDATYFERRNSNALENDDGLLQPRLDWLYADQNQDRERNVGRLVGFTEEDPAYGEAIFVVDDVDGDGVLEPGEKLVRLGTSKIRKVVVGERVYRRGDNLIDAIADERFGESMHGTGVMSIALGGQPGFHDRVGVAPGAEGVVYVSRDNQAISSNTFDDSTQIAAIEDALALGADAILHEWTNPFAVPHDGSTNVEAAMDQARREGMAQINPVGNLNISQKHLEAQLVSGAATELKFEVEGSFEVQGEALPYSIVYLSLQWFAEQEISLTLVNPDGVEQPIVFGDDPASVGGTVDVVQATLDVTTRGSRHAFLILWSPDTEATSIRQGTWTIRVESVVEDEVLFGRVSDYYSGWAAGVTWATPTIGSSTVVHPSTADSAFGVAAFGGRADDAFWDMSQKGELRNYSGRGPRFDGAPVVDIAAPDDPFAALAATEDLLTVGWGRTWFLGFGGTSGAGPHVAATYALLREAYPDETVDELEARIINGATTDALDPDYGALPNRAWGHGKLNAYRSIYEVEAPTSDAPPVALVTATRPELLVIDASSSMDPNGLPLFFRFDLDYDGAWDTDWRSDPILSIESDAEVIRVEVRNGAGLGAGALVHVSTGVNEDMGMGSPDMGTDADTARPTEKRAKSDDCSTADGSVTWIGLAFVALVGLIRRREIHA